MIRRALIFFAFTGVGLALVLLLSGCGGGPSILKGSGMEIYTPYQMQLLCQEQPELEICKPDTEVAP